MFNPPYCLSNPSRKPIDEDGPMDPNEKKEDGYVTMADRAGGTDDSSEEGEGDLKRKGGSEKDSQSTKTKMRTMRKRSDGDAESGGIADVVSSITSLACYRRG